jgi:hypothetical protein
LAGEVASSKPKQRELANARRTLEKNVRDLSRQVSLVARLAAELEIPPTEFAVNELIGKLEQELTEIKAEQTALDAAPTMRGLLDQVTPFLGQAESQGLGEQIAVDDPVSEVQLTVSQTRTGMTTRRSYLEGKPPPPEALEVAQHMDRAAKALARAKDLQSLFGEVSRLRRLAGASEDRVNKALATINPHAVAELRRLEEERRQIDDHLLTLVATRAALQQELGDSGDGTSESALAVQLREVLRRLGCSEAELPEATREAELTLERAQVALAQAQARTNEARRELAGAGAEIRRASAALADNASLGWIRRTLRIPMPTPEAGPQQQLAVLDAARETALLVRDRLGNLRAQLAAVESALLGAAKHLRRLDPETVRYLSEIETWLGNHFSTWFNTARVRTELLPTADGDIKVDIADRTVVWNEQGITRSRPLEAFSSGEQAFAYTRARLAALDEQGVRPPNRLIVLDEFGAFIAHDRLAGLLGYLRDRADDYPGDQVLVVLPLSRDYADLAKRALPSEAATYDKRAKEIVSRGYAVRPLES